MSGSDGFAGKIAMDSVLPFDTNSENYELAPAGESLSRVVAFLNTMGINGTRSQMKERTRSGQEVVSGAINLHASPTMLDKLLPRILGANESTDVFALAETLQSFQVMIDRVAKVSTYTDVYVNRAIFRGSSGGFLELSLEVIAFDESVGNAGTFPALTLLSDAPYIFEDGTLEIGGTAYSFFDFTLTIDNKLVSRFGNSVTATRTAPSDHREITLEHTNPFGATEAGAIRELAVTGVAVELAFTNGNTSLTFAMPAVQYPPGLNNISGKGEIPLRLVGIARQSGTDKELVVTNDSTT